MWRWAVVLAAFAVGFVNLPLRVVGRGFEYLPGDDIDNPLNNFVLEHGYRYLTGRADSFWSAPSYYPQPLITAWSDAHIGMQPVYSTLRISGLPPERALQGHFLISFALNYVAAAWALRRLGFSPFGVAGGAYLFAFGMPLVAQLNHVQLVPRFLVPLAVVLAWETLRAPRGWRLGALAACIVGQIYVSVYIGYFLLLLLAAGGGVSVARFRRELPWGELFPAARAGWKRRAGVCALAALALLPLAVGHARGLGAPARDTAKQLAPTPGAWVTPPSAALLFPEWGDATGWRSPLGEHQLFPGVLTLAAVAAGLACALRPGPLGSARAAVAVSACAAVLLVLLVTKFGGLWLYEPVTYLPGSGGIRAVGRVVLVLLFPLGVALAGGIDALVSLGRRAGRAVAPVVGFALLALVALDQSPCSATGARAAEWSELRHPLDHLRARQQRLADAIRTHPAPRLVYVFPSAAEPKRLRELVVQLEAMRAAQDLGLPCVNGWSGYVPHGWSYFAGYRELMAWLTETHAVAPDVLAGLVVVGEPTPDADAHYEATMRARFSPRSP